MEKSNSSFSSPSPPPIPSTTSKPRHKRSKNAHAITHKNNVGGSTSACGKRSSIYRGVTRHRWTGRYEAHLWDKNSWNLMHNKKGRQVYLGAYDDEEAAAHTYDLAALKYWGPDTVLNFPASTYLKEFEELQSMSKEEYLATLRRRSSGFSRGVSKYRGVARHHHNGRWEARIGRIHGNKYLYLGTFSTQEEAAQAYDMAALEYRGPNAVTNFNISYYTSHSPPSPMPMLEPNYSMAMPSPSSLKSLDKELSDIINIQVPDDFGDLLWSDMDNKEFDSSQEVNFEETNSLHDLFDCVGFEENIEHLFEGIDSDNGDLGNNHDDGGGGLVEERAGSTLNSAASYPPPVSIYS
ncbi:hypothetical protein M5K25_015243 [Dendrobium thyrsiflorum]|uniref:AP2/ERF domain-containing protein n=1 Tax=Dendrobium thyrsiflorum TaxID=117978 RepID=A0ABD0UQL0_DENTH